MSFEENSLVDESDQSESKPDTTPLGIESVNSQAVELKNAFAAYEDAWIDHNQSPPDTDGSATRAFVDARAKIDALGSAFFNHGDFARRLPEYTHRVGELGLKLSNLDWSNPNYTLGVLKDYSDATARMSGINQHAPTETDKTEYAKYEAKLRALMPGQG